MNGKFVFWLESTCNDSHFSLANVKKSAEMHPQSFWINPTFRVMKDRGFIINIQGVLLCFFYFFNFSQCVVCMFGHKNKVRSLLQREIFCYLCLAISVHAKVLHDPLVQYSQGLNPAQIMAILTPNRTCCFGKGRDNTETQSKLFNNHNVLGQLTNHNTFRFPEGGAFIKPGTNRVVCVRLGREVL